MRYSRQRELILKKVAVLDNHPTAEEIYREASRECPNLSLGTVYRNLNSLTAAGLVRRVPVPGQADRFDHSLHRHGHLCCTRCGSVTDVAVDEAALLASLRDSIGTVESFELTLFGVCEACRAKQA